VALMRNVNLGTGVGEHTVRYTKLGRAMCLNRVHLCESGP